MQRVTEFYQSAVLQTPSDTAGEIVDRNGNHRACHAFMVGIAGSVNVRCGLDVAPVVLAVEPGVVYPISVNRILAASTTNSILFTALFNDTKTQWGTTILGGAPPE